MAELVRCESLDADASCRVVEPPAAEVAHAQHPTARCREHQADGGLSLERCCKVGSKETRHHDFAPLVRLRWTEYERAAHLRDGLCDVQTPLKRVDTVHAQPSGFPVAQATVRQHEHE